MGPTASASGTATPLTARGKPSRAMNTTRTVPGVVWWGGGGSKARENLHFPIVSKSVSGPLRDELAAVLHSR